MTFFPLICFPFFFYNLKYFSPQDEEEEGEFEDDDEIPALEEVPSETLVQNNAHKKPPINGTNMPYPNKLTNGDKPNNTHATNSDLFGFGNSLTVKGPLA
jgi:hypothetical protein